MKRLVSIIFIFFALPIQAAWYENQRITWWIVVYSQMRCAPATEFDDLLRPDPLVNHIGCEYEAEYSEPEHIASIGCENVEGLDTGFVFAIDQEYCEIYLNRLHKAMSETPGSTTKP